jgi:hypothetical protein
MILSCIALGLSAAFAIADPVKVRLIGIETSRNDLYIKQGDDFKIVQVPLYERSNKYQMEPEGSSIQLYTRTETPEGEILFEVLTEGKLPAGAESALGVYLIAPDGSPQLHFYNDDWSVFPKRSYRIINISPVVINSKIDDNIIQVPPLESGTALANQSTDIPLVSVITVYKDGNDQWKSIYDQRVSLLPDWRTTGIAVITRGKLLEAQNPGYKMDPTKPMEAQLRYITFTDDAYTSAERLALRRKAAQRSE